jgi:hypothetical protein
MSDQMMRYWLARKDNTSKYTTTIEFVHDTAHERVLINLRKYDSREDLWEWMDSEWKFGNKSVHAGTWLTPAEGKLVWNHSLQEGFTRIDSVEVLRQ